MGQWPWRLLDQAPTLDKAQIFIGKRHERVCGFHLSEWIKCLSPWKRTCLGWQRVLNRGEFNSERSETPSKNVLAWRAMNALFVVVMLCSSFLPATEAGAIMNFVNCPVQCNCTSGPAPARRVHLHPRGGTFVIVDCSLRLLDQIPEDLVDRAHGVPMDNSSTDIVGLLDLSHNRLTSVQTDRINDDLQPVSGVNVTSDAFAPTSPSDLVVIAIDLSHNLIANISSLDLSAYRGTEHLDLSHNVISQIDGWPLSHVLTLQTLNLSHNSIEFISPDAFQKLIHLEVLDLSFNDLQTNQLHFILHGLSDLKCLYLNDNRLKQIAFPSLPGLVHLDLARNQIESIVPGALSDIISLERLDLRDNRIADLQYQSFAGLDKLEELQLDRNLLSTLGSPHAFANLSSLLSLSLSSMANLTNVTYQAFLGLSNLQYLNLSHNPQLTFLPPSVFEPLIHLQFLDLSHCGLQVLSQITFHASTDLKEVLLQDNAFNCSCINGWLAKESQANASKFSDASTLQCLTDLGTVVDIWEGEYSCEDITLYNMTSVVSARLGSQLLLRCQHQSDTPSVLTWTTPRGKQYHLHHIHPEASLHLLSEKDIQPDTEFHRDHYWHHTSTYHSEIRDLVDRVLLLSDGSLYIDYLLRSDTGTYKCQVSNAHFNQSAKVSLYLSTNINKDVKEFAFLVGILCALTFFALNVVYVIISWTARRLVNKRRREIIRQMLEALNAYKSSQMTRIHENYTHQLSRVRNQYHVQRDRLHKNYTHQVGRMKRGCSNQVERVRDNYHTKLTQLREYSSNQIVQIRERANNQIVRIRDYGSSQLDRLRETYKLQQQHVLKLLDTMNLDNCRHVVETECMRTESMMFDIDLLGDLDDRTDSPMSAVDSEYKTASSSPATSFPDDQTVLSQSQQEDESRDIDNQYNKEIVIEMKTNLDLENGVQAEASRMWVYDEQHPDNHEKNSSYFLNIHSLDEDANCLDEEFDIPSFDPDLHVKAQAIPHSAETVCSGPKGPLAKVDSVSEDAWEPDYMTPETSPVRRCPLSQGVQQFSLEASGQKDEIDEETCEVILEGDFHQSPETIL